MSTFQIITLVVFGVFVAIGVGVFAIFGGLGGGSSVGTVVVWGTADAGTMQALIQTLNNSDKSFSTVTYVQKKPATYQSDLVAAMASGAAPDLFLVSQGELESFADKVLVIPYGAVSQGTFTSSFIDEANLFLTPQGSLALPFMIDPLVMYYNRDLLSAANIASPPKYWSDLLALAPSLSSVDPSGNIKQSAAALGAWSNIQNAKAILSALMLQAGDPIVARGASGAPAVVLGTVPQGAAEGPAQSALQFYTEFGNPSKNSYSWNRSLPEAQSAFLAGTVAFYFGFASEQAQLAARNPNLAIGVALLPQIKGNAARATYGTLSGFAIPKTSRNPNGAETIAIKLTSQSALAQLAAAGTLPPARRDVSVDTGGNAALDIFVQSSLISKGWLDPAPTKTDALFQTMVESVVSGASTPAQAVSDAARALAALLSQSQ